MNVRRIFLAGVLFASCLFSQSLFAQASTEGKEFWVALTIGRAPGDLGTDNEAYLCVSSKTRSGSVTITNPQTHWTKTYAIPPMTGWLEIRDIPWDEIYPFDNNTRNQQNASGKTYDVGLQVTATVEVSVFAALRYKYAFDATNILPITALQSEYIIQDYPPYANIDGSKELTTSFSNFCILATEDNTEIEITPHTRTKDGKQAGSTYIVKLEKGDVYYVVSEQGSENDAKSQSLSGSYVKAKNNKKIAVFNGNICTRTPNNKSARDIHYEQAFPLDYWGNEFILTRSREKDANRFRITAQEDNTQITINGTPFTTINARETYEIELAVANDMKDFNLATKDQFVADAIYVQTSCPCAIYSYDTGNSYNSQKQSEIYKEGKDDKYGDPSSAWVSPLQQKINDITFGVMNTDMTKRHFVNIVTETQYVSSIELRQVSNGKFSNNLLTATDFIVLTGTKYSYARKALDIDTASIYKLSCKNGGFIATVYGNGKNESYAYSAGSAAVKRGVNIDGTTHTEGTISDQVYCVQTPIEFDAQVGTDIIDKVDWDFGDGVTITNGPTKTTHTYDSPGWYDITANVYAHKECPYTTYPAEAVSFSFRVRRPDTTRVVVRGDCKPWDYTGKLQEIDSVQPDDCATDTFEIRTIVYGKDTRDTTDHGDKIVHDSIRIEETGKWLTYDFAPGGKGLYEDSIVSENKEGCRHTHVYRYNLTILTCLNMQVSDASEAICADPQADDIEMYTIPFTYYKGQIAHAALLLNGKRINAEADLSAQTLSVPLNEIEPGIWNATIEVWDSICSDTLSFPYRFVANYPEYIFRQKFDNVLAVYTTAFNGGYTFTGYQWYKDGEPIDGATSSIYHTTDPLATGATYYVLLTREDGLVLPSCEQTIEGNNANAQSAPKAEKVISNKHLYIKLNGTLFDVYGNRVE